MITHDQILPSLLQLQRTSRLGEITVCARQAATLNRLRDAPALLRAFPGQQFHPLEASFETAIATAEPGGIAVIALPDHLHFNAVMAALDRGLHVCCVKPLVLSAAESVAIEVNSRRRGLLVAVEYHKRFDDRSLMARSRYRAGRFGQFRLGTAHLMEKWYYRDSNFQNWCTTDQSDAFTYIGCHYVDLVHFITGLLPVAVSVYGIRDRFPNGSEGFLWADARVIWSNGACLNVQTSLSFPDAAPGTNSQGLTLYCGSVDRGALLRHSDQYRGLEYCYTAASEEPGATVYAEPSPDYFQYLDLGGAGLTPAGYGFRSLEAIITACLHAAALPTLAGRQAFLHEVDREGLLATPLNSRFNELVVEAGRQSILNGAREVLIQYEPQPHTMPQI